MSYKICDKLSVGAGLTVAWGNFDLSRSMFPVGAATNNTIAGILTANGMGQYAPLFTNAGDNALLSAKLAGDAQVAVGVNVGIMWDVHEQWTFGFNYRSRLNMKVKKGTAEMNYHSPEIKQVMSATGLIPRLDEGTFNAELPLPTNLTWAVAFRPAEKWEFAVDLQWVGWSAYKELNVSFNEPELKIEDINSVKNYKNTLAFRFGGEYKACDLIQARMGMYVDESPVRSDYLNPETPSMTKLAYTAGLTINPVKCMSIDVALRLRSIGRPRAHGFLPLLQLTDLRRRLPTGSDCRRLEDRSGRIGGQSREPALLGQLCTACPHVLDRCKIPFLKTEKITIFAGAFGDRRTALFSTAP